jgi:hypothetical protein
MYIKVVSSDAVDVILKYSRDHKEPNKRQHHTLWSDIGLEWEYRYEEGLYLTCRVIDKQKLVYAMMKYGLQFEVIDV